MKIFVDTANLDEIREALETGWVDGVTTNPSLLAKEPKGKFEEHIGKIVAVLQEYYEREYSRIQGKYPHLSVEVFAKEPDQIREQVRHFKKTFDYPLSIKIQVGWNELALIRSFAESGISVNCTACMSVSQAAWAAKAGAKYASLFWGRIRDANPKVIQEKISFPLANKAKPGDEELLSAQLQKSRELLASGAAREEDFDPVSVAGRTRALFDREKFGCEIIAGSIRTIWDMRDAMLAGVHIVTVPYKFFPEFSRMVQHFKTDEVISQFLTDFEKWLR